MTRSLRLISIALAIGAAGCATHDGASSDTDLRWTAHGYLTPGATSDPEIIGSYETEAECREAVDWWMSRQVVGNPVSGECLPTDRH